MTVKQSQSHYELNRVTRPGISPVPADLVLLALHHNLGGTGRHMHGERGGEPGTRLAAHPAPVSIHLMSPSFLTFRPHLPPAAAFRLIGWCCGPRVRSAALLAGLASQPWILSLDRLIVRY
jgi:hypothetical protein